MCRNDNVATFLCRLYRNSGNLKVRSLSWRVTPLQDGKFPVNQFNESYTFLRTTQNLSVFYIDFNQFGTSSMQGITTKPHCCVVTFVKIGALKAMVSLGIFIFIFHMFCPSGVQFRIGDLHIMFSI